MKKRSAIFDQTYPGKFSATDFYPGKFSPSNFYPGMRKFTRVKIRCRKFTRVKSRCRKFTLKMVNLDQNGSSIAAGLNLEISFFLILCSLDYSIYCFLEAGFSLTQSCSFSAALDISELKVCSQVFEQSKVFNVSCDMNLQKVSFSLVSGLLAADGA